jgi:hypothetical protein
MKKTFGDKRLREKMLLDPLLKGQWEESPKVHALNPTDHLIAKIGIGIVTTVERYYAKYLEKPNETNARAYCLWRLRLHRLLKNDVDQLMAINQARSLGLNDTAPGKTCWNLNFD